MQGAGASAINEWVTNKPACPQLSLHAPHSWGSGATHVHISVYLVPPLAKTTHLRMAQYSATDQYIATIQEIVIHSQFLFQS